MHHWLRAVLDEFASDPVPVGSSDDLVITQPNLVLVVWYGHTGRVQSQFAENRPEARCTRDIFPSLTYRFGRPKVTMMQFATGKTVFVGGANYPATLYCALLHRIRLEQHRARHQPEVPRSDLVFCRPHKANLVFTANLPGGRCFDLARFAASATDISYNPSTFPGANRRVFDEHGNAVGTAVFFERGRINFMGSRSEHDAVRAIHQLAAELAPYACAERPTTSTIVHDRERERQAALTERNTRNRRNTVNLGSLDAVEDLIADDRLMLLD